MRILAICSTFPYPPTRGGTQGRTFNLLKLLADTHDITLVTLRAADVTEAEIQALQQWMQVQLFPFPETAQTGVTSKLQRFGQFLLSGTPPNVAYLYSPEAQAWIDQAVAAHQFDAITCEHSVNEVYVRPGWKDQLTTVLNVHSSLYRTLHNQLQTQTSENPWRDRLFLPLLKRYEKAMLHKFSTVVVTTDEDQRQMENFDPQANVRFIPNCVDLETFPYRGQDPGGYHLVFVGGLDYFVNIDAAVFFSNNVLPILQEKYPNTRLTLVGAKPASAVQALAQRPGITVTGRVPSVADYLHQATVAVIPLNTGFGMKFKTLEAMAAGAPIVASDRGLEGLQVDGPDIPLRAIRANEVGEYVAAITRLFTDAQLRQQLSHNGRQYIEQNYVWPRAAELYAQVITDKAA